MKYFIAAFIAIFALVSLSGAPQAPTFDYPEESYSEIVCDLSEGNCIENITFPAMHINAEITK
tara:strand:+ start:3512 stop:3700 length:189 start_codon:yes stop_codon:yes gene_type:complete